MTEIHGTSVLHRKLAPRAASQSEDSDAGVGPARVLVRSFARAVSECAPLMAEGGVRSLQTLSLAELIDSIDPDAFVGLLTGGDAPPGLAVIDQTGFAALVEAMTIGRLAAREPASRRATATDAALLGEVLNAALAGLDADDPAMGLAMQRAVPDNRLLPVLLDDLAYTLVTLQVSLVSGDSQRSARIVLAVPQSGAAILATVAGQPDGAPLVSTPALDWSTALEASVMVAPAALHAELGRVTLPLYDVLALGQGDTVTLPLSNLEEVRLVALDGTLHAAGRLGQSRGMRAVRLTTHPGGPPEAGVFEQARAPMAREGEAAMGQAAPDAAPPARQSPAPPQDAAPRLSKTTDPEAEPG